MRVISFLKGLGPEFEGPRAQVLSGTQIPSLDDVYLRLERTEEAVVVASNSALIGRRDTRGGRPPTPSVKSGSDRRPESSGERRPVFCSDVECYFCHKLGHLQRDCRKLQSYLQKAHLASSDKKMHDKFAQLKVSNAPSPSSASDPPPPAATLAESANNHCLLSSSTKWVIDSGATAHMTGSTVAFCFHHFPGLELI